MARKREHYDRYKGTDVLWLTSRGNRHSSKSLRRILHRLCDRAGIETANRKMSWYMIRHSVGIYMTKERDLAAAKAQLRHKNPMTMMKYDQVPRLGTRVAGLPPVTRTPRSTAVGTPR